MGFEPIRTERLLLRPMRLDDIDAVHARRNHPDVARYQTWTLPYPRERAERMVAEVVAMDGPTNDDSWMLTIADPADTTTYGDFVVELSWRGRTAEIGYTLDPAAWGRGYAVEAATAMVEYLFTVLGTTRVQGMLHPDNPASAMVLERVGMTFEGHTRSSFWVGEENSDDWIYGMTRDDWEAWRSRPRHRPALVELVEVTPDNLGAVVKMATHKSQERFVAPNLYSLAEALVPEVDDGHPVVPWYRAIAADGDLVGFVMLSLPNPVQDAPYLWRLLIDRMHQRRGIGSMVLDLLVAECTRMGATVLDVSWAPGRGSPEPLYLGRGFVPTGEIDDGEIVARLQL